jgi:predicted alpha/beta hydrolase
VLSGITNSSTGALYEATTVKDWARQDFPALAAQVRVPVQFSVAEHERVWRSDHAALADIAAMFTASPRFAVNKQVGAGHNLSLSVNAAAYHFKVLSFVEECVTARERASAQAKLEAG